METLDSVVPLPCAIKECKQPLTLRERIMVDSVDKFYDDPANFKRLRKVLQSCKPSSVPKSGHISLRLLDFLCSTYAEQKPIVLKPKKLPAPVNLKNVYCDGLHAYGKLHYDCFKRNHRFKYEKHGHQITTTVGQLMYFKDAMNYGILDYAETHQEEIKRAMQEQSQELLWRKKRINNKQKQRPLHRKKHKRAVALIEMRPQVYF